MKTLLTTIPTILMLAFVAACATTAGHADPWGGIAPTDTYQLAEGSRITVEHDGARAVDVRVEGGHLWLNDEDLGAYDGSGAVRFLRDGRLTVDGATRGRLPAR